MAVVIGSLEAEAYRVVIERLKPQIVVAHYCCCGTDLCHERGIRFFQVIHHTYTLEARREIRGRHGLDDQDFVSLSVGSINHQKNHIATVRAFATVSEELQHAKLVILGPVYEKNLLKEIEHLIEERALGKRVIDAGATSSAKKYMRWPMHL